MNFPDTFSPLILITCLFVYKVHPTSKTCMYQQSWFFSDFFNKDFHLNKIQNALDNILEHFKKKYRTKLVEINIHVHVSVYGIYMIMNLNKHFKSTSYVIITAQSLYARCMKHYCIHLIMLTFNTNIWKFKTNLHVYMVIKKKILKNCKPLNSLITCHKTSQNIGRIHLLLFSYLQSAPCIAGGAPSLSQ